MFSLTTNGARFGEFQHAEVEFRSPECNKDLRGAISDPCAASRFKQAFVRRQSVLLASRDSSASLGMTYATGSMALYASSHIKRYQVFLASLWLPRN